MKAGLLSCRSLLMGALMALAGCRSYTIVQRNFFSDDDGSVVSVEYGHAESVHVNTFVSPVTGKEMEFKSKLLVVAHLPDGDSFKAWQCMNFLPRGTLYKTDDEQWMLLAHGFSCIIYEQTKEDKTKYLEVYRGILCETAPVENDYNSKWKKVSAPQTGRYSSKQEEKANESAR